VAPQRLQPELLQQFLSLFQTAEAVQALSSVVITRLKPGVNEASDSNFLD
jgi:hypothetical protein